MEEQGQGQVNMAEQHIAMLSQNLKYITNRLVNTEMALDVFLGIMFEEEGNEELKNKFEVQFKERMEGIRQQYEEHEKQQAEAMANQAKEEENVDVIVTPNGQPANV